MLLAREKKNRGPLAIGIPRDRIIGLQSSSSGKENQALLSGHSFFPVLPQFRRVQVSRVVHARHRVLVESEQARIGQCLVMAVAASCSSRRAAGTSFRPETRAEGEGKTTHSPRSCAERPSLPCTASHRGVRGVLSFLYGSHSH